MSKFSLRLKALRNDAHVTQQELADAIGMSKSSVNMYERGEREPSFETLECIADFFNVDMDYLHGKSNIKNRIKYKSKQRLAKRYRIIYAKDNSMTYRVIVINNDDYKLFETIKSLNDKQKETLSDFIEYLKTKK